MTILDIRKTLETKPVDSNLLLRQLNADTLFAIRTIQFLKKQISHKVTLANKIRPNKHLKATQIGVYHLRHLEMRMHFSQAGHMQVMIRRLRKRATMRQENLINSGGRKIYG